ncbi:MAG: hypothetical protein IJ226_01635 [Clostridia bacterium]|nr:hypothetical protein [Clostridia bacterium]
MKKLNVSKTLIYSKWVAILLVALVLIVYGRTIKSPTLTKTQIVLGAGIDFDVASREFEVTTQSMMVASSFGESNTQTTYNVYSAKGRTVAEALDVISRKIGLNISLAHCNVLFLSNTALAIDHLQLFYPLTGMYSLPEQSMIVACAIPPKELLSKRIGSTVSSALFLQNSLSNQEGDDGMIRTTVKDFLCSSLSRSHANALPYVEVQKLESEPQNAEGEVKDAFELILNRALVTDKEKAYVLSEELSEILSIYLSSDVTGCLNYTSEKGESVEFKVLSEDVKLKADGRTVFANIKISVDLLDVQFVDSDRMLNGADDIVQTAANELGNILKQRLLELFDLSKSLDIDFLGLQAKAYQSVGRSLEENCLETLSFVPSVKIVVSETA